MRRTIDWLTILAFLATIVGGLVTTRFGPLVSAREGNLQPWAQTGMDALGRWKLGFQQEFGARSAFLAVQQMVRLRLLREPLDPSVIEGRHGWLFLGHYGAYDGTDDFLRRHPMPDAQLDRWLAHFEAKRRSLAVRGIPYLVFFAPNKPTIYPEEMPADLVPRPGPSRLEQMLTALRTRSQIHFFDVQEALLADKARERVYYKTDTHWNEAGALTAYLRCVEEMGVPPLSSSPTEPRLPEDTKDLARMCGLTDYFAEDAHNPQYSLVCAPAKTQLRWNREWQEDPAHPVPSQYVAYSVVETHEPGAPRQRALFLGDSFLGALGPLLAADFSYSERIWTHTLDLAEVDTLHPQLVLEEVVERDLAADPPPAILPYPAVGHDFHY